VSTKCVFLKFRFWELAALNPHPFPLGAPMPRSLRHDLSFIPSWSFWTFPLFYAAHCGRVQRTLISCSTYRTPCYRQKTTWTNWTRLVMTELNYCMAHWSLRIHSKVQLIGDCFLCSSLEVRVLRKQVTQMRIQNTPFSSVPPMQHSGLEGVADVSMSHNFKHNWLIN
jgi:hypothetical protein